MADSDGENERFAKNVMNELDAFQVKEKPTSENEEVASTETKNDTKSDQIEETDIPKPPSRIIRLSRPLNPYGSNRTAQSIPTSNIASSSTSTSSGSTVSAAPGSRLAALQRPGSPMQKFLQRSKSPALAAAAARLGQSASEKGNNQSTKNAEGESSVSSESQIGNQGANQNSDLQTSSLRSTMPPRIQSSGLSGSILLRRPQSPLNTNRTSLLTKKSTDNAADESPISPRASESESQDTAKSTEASGDAEREAIRNKLRANSFRLKGLLEKRPFVRTRGRNDSEGKEDSSSAQSAESSDGQADSSDDKASRDRTRWRTDGPSVANSQRSRLTETTSSRLASRSVFRTRTNPDIGQNNGDKSHDSAEVSDQSNIESGSLANSQGMDTIKSNNHIGIITDDNKKLTETPTVGATLLRSPRTRAVSLDSSQPSGSDHTGQGRLEGKAADHKSVADLPHKREQAVTELEKDNEVNLVFDSVTIGQSNNNPEENTVDTKAQASMSKSMYSGTPSHSNASSRPHVSSEPATPITEQRSLTNSQSFENSLDADFLRSSPNLKRSFAVTDLDKAMYERDKQKLSSIFKESSQDQGESTSEGSNMQEKVKGGHVSQLETDLDEQYNPLQRGTHSPRIQHKLGKALEDLQGVPAQNPPVNPVAPLVYKPNVNLEDAVKWPMDIPGKLDFRTMEVFEGQMLLNWLTNSVDKSHYLRLVMTKHDMNVIACQICTCLVAAGVMKQLESKEAEHVFKTDCMYYWTHTQQPVAVNAPQDVNKLTPMWPPTQEESEETKPGLKYTEADHQAAMVKLRYEYNEEVDKLQVEQKGVLDRARTEYETRLQQSMERIVLLQKEVEKYKCLAGIEKLTQDALSDNGRQKRMVRRSSIACERNFNISDRASVRHVMSKLMERAMKKNADAARQEAGLQPDATQTNGFATPASQHLIPGATPDVVAGQLPLHLNTSPADLFPDLTTPAELRQDGSETSRSETSSLAESESSTGAPPPAPPPPPGAPPAPGAPPPPPPPPAFGVHRSESLKPVVKPLSPMKPLFWQRLQVMQLKTPKNKEYLDKKLLWEEIKEEEIDVKEFDDLFSKTNVEPSRRFNFNKPKAKTKQPAKVISPKRSQAIGILLSSLRVEMSDIEYAIMNFDTSLIGEEKLRHIYENRGDADEVKKLKDFVKKHPDTPLDKPDQFLYDLTHIPDHSERIFCFLFREAFQESISVIDNKMTNLKMTCQTLISSSAVKKILGLVLALGNYMNGGSKQRGQADGFGIDILPKLKDVKSKDSSISLLHYVVQQYVKKYEKHEAGTEKVKLPLPDPSDLHQASLVNYDELDKELKRIKKDFEAAEQRAEKVISSATEHHQLQPFKDIMEGFFEKGKQEFQEQAESIVEGKKIFQEAALVFCMKPKSGDKEVTPEYFFTNWCTFCKEFKDIWKREQQKVIKMRIRENELRVKKMQENIAKKPVRTRTRKPGGLKDRLAKQGLLES